VAGSRVQKKALSTIRYEKWFPDLQTLINGLPVYSAIQDIYDLDRKVFGLNSRSTTGGQRLYRSAFCRTSQDTFPIPYTTKSMTILLLETLEQESGNLYQLEQGELYMG
jgi:hypothetical protein